MIFSESKATKLKNDFAILSYLPSLNYWNLPHCWPLHLLEILFSLGFLETCLVALSFFLWGLPFNLFCFSLNVTVPHSFIFGPHFYQFSLQNLIQFHGCSLPVTSKSSHSFWIRDPHCNCLWNIFTWMLTGVSPQIFPILNSLSFLQNLFLLCIPTSVNGTSQSPKLETSCHLTLPPSPSSTQN